MLDIKVIKQAIKGNEDAFEQLIKYESGKLYKTAFLYVRNKEDALDVLQETVCKAFVGIKKLKEPKYFSTWLVKILIRTAYEVLQKKKKVVLTGEAFIHSLTENVYHSPEEDLDLTQAISNLDQNYQTVIILFYFHDLSIKKIAETMQKPEGTIKTYLHRAKIELKRLLEGAGTYGQRMV
ncbi:sigma-70 family RNA polymerase sigma factor [Fictibacillus nanhaiensis]|uniref:sigma-70 family RNA polymerase sigma factor n=1 Tax=Fictibacillus nanhaiensis TaxID=742169 RepID=UPI001C954D19|nr:sigma-70 family RNA polymerase sigma factor [Fictibacillus nanhaiensis]MBY6038156.1 sigma-70 family RNA polymerase sigma factor [Fictibacillus nanhaiensis]